MTNYSKNPTAIAAMTKVQFNVTQNNGTEPPGTGEYLHQQSAGLYVDLVSGEPLFTTTNQYNAGCGWPSFTQPVNPESVREVKDTTHGMIRVEVRSTIGDSHLGHVFTDGPQAHGGLRYCINSAALHFIPLEDMQAQGYGHLVEDIKKAINHDS